MKLLFEFSPKIHQITAKTSEMCNFFYFRFDFVIAVERHLIYFLMLHSTHTMLLSNFHIVTLNCMEPYKCITNRRTHMIRGTVRAVNNDACLQRGTMLKHYGHHLFSGKSTIEANRAIERGGGTASFCECTDLVRRKGCETMLF